MAYADTDTAPSATNEAEFLSEARSLYDFDLKCDQEDRAEAEEDNGFANASDADRKQWDPVALAMRSVPGAERPIQQWNRIPTYVQQVVNDGRANKPAIKIVPAEGGRKETADYFQDRIRHIEYECNSDTAYDTARDQQVTSGRGFIRVDTEWIPGKFKQRICISPIENQFSVVFDSGAKLYDRSDATRCFVISRISQAQHIRDYGKDSIVSQIDFATNYENPAPDWVGVGDQGNLIQIAEYWRKEFEKRRLLLLGSTGLPVWKDALTPEQYETFKLNGQILAERDEQHATIYQFVINGAEILSKTVWPGTTIPIVPVWGRCAVVDGRRRTFSLIRNAKDPQRLVNLYVSNIAEQIAMMPKTPYIVSVGAIPANMEDDWANIGNSTKGFVQANQYGHDGKELRAPTRENREPPIQALSIGLQQAIEGIKASMGIYDASLGARSNETSGIAIDQRRKSAEIVNFHFPDNEARSRKRIGQILIELIPLIDKPGSEVTVRSERGETRTVPIGTPYSDPKTGKEVTHVLTDGDYGVSVGQGPTFANQRQQAYERDAELIKANPELIYAIGPQMFRDDDAPQAEERAEALERYINIKFPGLIPPKEQEGQPPIPPEVQQEILAAKKDAEEAHAFAQSLHEKVQTDEIKSQSAKQIKEMEIAAEAARQSEQLDFERWKVEETERTKREVALAQIDQKDAIEALHAELGIVKHEQDRMAAEMNQRSQQDHEAGQSEAERVAATEARREQQQHEAEQAEAGHERTLEQQDASAQATLEQQKHAAALAPEPKEKSNG